MAEKFLEYMKAFLQGASPKNDTASRRFFIVTTYMLIFSGGIFTGKLFSDNEGRISHELICQVKENQILNLQKSVASHSPVDPEAPAQAKPPEPVIEAAKPVEVPKVAEPVAAPAVQAAAPTAPVVQPASVAPTSLRDVAAASGNVGKFTVQIAVNSTVENAKKAVADLSGKQVEASYWEVTSSSGKKQYVVGSGLFSTVEDAKKHQTELAKKYTLQTYIHKFK